MINQVKVLLFSFLLINLFGISFSARADIQSYSDTNIPLQCKKLFIETEKLIAEAEKQPGTHIQVSKIKNKLNQSKKQILEMELATQIKSCDHGLAKLTNLKEQADQ